MISSLWGVMFSNADEMRYYCREIDVCEMRK